MKELVLVGAGPHALTLMAWLLEEIPDSSVDANFRLVYSKTQLKHLWQQQCKAGRRVSLASWLNTHVAVIDERGEWNARWNEQFDGLHIPHLRSPASVHPSPETAWALEGYAQLGHRCSELVEMKWMPKSPDFHGPFWLPGTRLFSDFCDSVVQRYSLDGLVTRQRVTNIIPEHAQQHSPCSPLYSLHLSDGSFLHSRRVVVAVGSTNIPRIPAWAADLMGGSDVNLTFKQLSCGAPYSVGQEKQGMGGEEGKGNESEVMLPRGVVLHAWDVARIFARVVDVHAGGDCSIKGQSATGCTWQHSQHSSGGIGWQSSCISGGEQNDSKQDCNSSSSSSSSSSQRGGHFSSSDSGKSANGSSESDSDRGTQEKAAPLLTPTPTDPPPMPDNPDCAMGLGCSVCADPANSHTCPPSAVDNGGCAECTAAAVAAAPVCLRPGCASLEGARVVLVGGGLTAAQLALLAIKHGCRDCIILMRGQLKVKQFDVGVSWLGRSRQRALKTFGLHTPGDHDKHDGAGKPTHQRQGEQDARKGACNSCDDEGAARLDCLKKATGGGSMSPEVLRLLMPAILVGQVRLVEGEEIIAAGWDDSHQWATTDSTHAVGAWELQLASTGTQMTPRAVARVLREAEAAAHAHAHKHTRGQDHAHGEKGGCCEVSSEDELLRQPGASGTDGGDGGGSNNRSGSSEQQCGVGGVGCEGGSGGVEGQPKGRDDSSCSTRSMRSIRCDSRDMGEDGLLYAHHVWLATGSVVDVQAEPVFSGLLSRAPIPVYGGMPMLEPDLRWRKETNVWVLGAYASLRLGPGAANLMGARTAASIVSNCIKSTGNACSSTTGNTAGEILSHASHECSSSPSHADGCVLGCSRGEDFGWLKELHAIVCGTRGGKVIRPRKSGRRGMRST